MKKINAFQISTLIILFQMGSAIVLGIGKDAGKDSWITILAGAVIGNLLFFLYTSIYSSNSGSTFKDLLCMSFGKYLGNFFSLLYGLYFLYISARVVGDFAFFIQNEFLTVSTFLVKVTILIAVCQTAYWGIETLGRSGELFLFITLFILIPIFILVFINDSFEFYNLLPLQEDANKIIKALYPLVITVPFGEIVVFLTIFKNVTDFKKFAKRGWISVSISGVLLATASVITLGVLSKEVATELSFPFVKAVQNINIDVLPHLEIIIVIIFMIGGLIKISIFFYGGIDTLSILFGMKNYNKLIIPTLFSILIITIMFMKNFTEHVNFGLKIVPYYMHLPFQVCIPFCMFISLFIRKMFSKKT